MRGFRCRSYPLGLVVVSLCAVLEWTSSIPTVFNGLTIDPFADRDEARRWSVENNGALAFEGEEAPIKTFRGASVLRNENSIDQEERMVFLVLVHSRSEMESSFHLPLLVVELPIGKISNLHLGFDFLAINFFNQARFESRVSLDVAECDLFRSLEEEAMISF